MKTTIFAFILLLHSLVFYGQNRVYNIKDTTNEGLTMSDLDSIYKNGLSANDSTNPVFSHEAFDSIVKPERQKLLRNLRAHFDDNGFNWQPALMIWTRMYVDENGRIDYLLYHFITPINSIKEAEFRKTVNKFLMENKLNISAPVKFSICGRVVFKE
ncbi:MAG: hypothetical protein ACOC4J_03165 [Bacteroidota bacterium]